MHNKSELFGIFVGAETGLLKGVTTDHSTWHNLTNVDKVAREKEITALCWQNDDQTELCVGHRDGSIDIYSNTDKEIINSNSDIIAEGYLRGLLKWNSLQEDQPFLYFIKPNVFVISQLLSLDVGADLYCLRQNPNQRHIIATGGKENDLKIWNLEQPEQPLFKAKNVRHDWLNLRVPIWVRDAAFLPGSDKVVTCTGYHQSGLGYVTINYHVSYGSVVYFSQVVVGNTQGLMALVDLRGKGHLVQKYKGFAGSIRDIQCHPSQDIVISCSLDRYLRIHDINTRQLLNKFYMKSRLNCCLVADKVNSQIQPSELPLLSPIEMEQKKTDDDYSQSESSEDEQLWKTMGIVKTRQMKMSSSRKRLKQQDEHLDDGDSDFEDGSDDNITLEVKNKAKQSKTSTMKRKQPQSYKSKKKHRIDQK
ncbi:hypothetical protein LSH36_1385g00035 [Paralvinella palmiformis]|uniref:Anaphase-promoting complex subunit 4-like WD40 domain-containing protein n=1 Tax=Paralvinella palmiformis TaxID=53620 RepID=A0AAD9ITK5_9ANNE|nr:hypothetical protein LSH36_1385g00035 [Paralvinella palmiformis]